MDEDTNLISFLMDEGVALFVDGGIPFSLPASPSKIRVLKFLIGEGVESAVLRKFPVDSNI